MHDFPSPPPKRRLTWLQLLGTAYLYNCGGAYGIEQAVGAAGPFTILVALVVAGLLWALPQALITAELATAFPKGGSSLYWVEQGLGRRWAYVSSVCLNVGQVFDLALYPGLITSYAASLLPALSQGPNNAWAAAPFGVQMACIAVVCACNILGLQLVSTSSWIMLVITTTPFFVFPFVAAGKGMAFDFSSLSPSIPSPLIASGGGDAGGLSGGVGVFISTILWTFQGWTSLGSLAGEVDDPKRAYPLTMLVLVTLTVLSYAYPIVFGAALDGNMADWVEGYWSPLLNGVSSWLGVWVLVGAALANFGSGLNATAMYSRFLAACASEGYLPGFGWLGGTTLGRLGAGAASGSGNPQPIPAILFLTATTMTLTNVSFASLLGVDTLFNALNVFLVAAAFLRLRLTRPSLPRPYTVPGGKWAATTIALVTCALVIVAISIAAAASWLDLVVTAGIVVAIYAGAAWRERRRERSGEGARGDDEVEEETGDDEGGGLRKGLLLLVN